MTFGLSTNPPIGQALSDDAFRGLGHALGIINPEFFAVVVNEIAFREVAGKVLVRDVMVRPVDRAFHDREKSLDRVGMPEMGLVVERRRAIGMTQDALAKAYREDRSFISRIERLQRRLDVYEYAAFCQILKLDPGHR